MSETTLSGTVEAIGRGSSIFERRPIGSAITMIVIASVAMFFIMKSVFGDQIKDLKADKKECRDQQHEMFMRIMEQNNIISEQDKAIQEADSSIRKKSKKAVDFLYKNNSKK